ncbi:hypothetical protein LJR220_000664 [Bradyrhizobium sp. LjRoot220]
MASRSTRLPRSRSASCVRISTLAGVSLTLSPSREDVAAAALSGTVRVSFSDGGRGV